MADKAREIEALGDGQGIDLMIFDPVLSYFGEWVNTHNTAQVRRALARLHLLAEQTGAAILGLGHVNKMKGQDIRDRFTGSAVKDAKEELADSGLIPKPKKEQR